MRSLLPLMLCLGCASGMKFTRPEELEEIAKAPLPATPRHELANVAEWELTGPLPERIEHVPLADGSKPFVKLLLASAPRLQPMQDLTCVAAQMARFELANAGKSPGLLLRRFIEARCGTPSDHVQTSTLFGEAPPETSDDALVEHWSKDVQAMLARVPDGAFAGVALERKGNQARLVISSSQDEVEIEPISIYPKNDVVLIRGVIHKTVEDVSGAINQGTDVSAPCVENPTVKLPRFELACPVQMGSPHDWVGVWAREPGRFLAYPIFTTLVWSDGAPNPKFVRPTIGLAKDGTPEAFLEALNAVRGKLGRAPMTMSSPQTEQARSLVAPYLSAELNGDASKVDRIAMGLMAGWRVEGAVTNGWFTSFLVPAEAGAEMLAALLELPGQRNELLSKEARVLALGQSESQGLVESLVCTYALLDEPSPTVARQQQLIEKLNAERKRRGLPAAQWVQLPTKTSETVAAAVRATTMDPNDGIEELMTEAQQVIRKQVRGWQFYAASLDEVQWPDELLERPTLQVMMTIAPWKRKDMPWTQYVFMVVLFEGAGTQA